MSNRTIENGLKETIDLLEQQLKEANCELFKAQEMVCLNCGLHTHMQDIIKEYRFYTHRHKPPNACTHLYVRGIGQYWNCGPVVYVSDYPYEVQHRTLEDDELDIGVRVTCTDGELISVIRFKNQSIPKEFDFKSQ